MKTRQKGQEKALAEMVWQDREVFFNLKTKSVKLIKGETCIETLDNVEDVKGNKGDRGTLKVTNLRLIWQGVHSSRDNVSIGYKAISGIATRMAKSKIRGDTESLYVLAVGLINPRFEFVFTCINKTNTKLFSTVIGMHRAYETSKLCRELRMRTAFVNDDETLKLFSFEYQCEKFEGVCNLSSSQGNFGVLVLTNIRVMWYASMNLLYNVSIPYHQLRSCRVRDSRFGYALVFETSIQSGEYVLGFRVDPPELLESVCRSVQALRNAFHAAPIFGVQYITETNNPILFDETASDSNDIDKELEEDDKAQRVDAFAAYFTEGSTNMEEGEENTTQNIVYSEELGVAIQRLKPGFTIADLWEINVN